MDKHISDEFELFRNMLMNEFLRLCNYNDYNKLTLLKIGDVVNECFDKSLEAIKKTQGEMKFIRKPNRIGEDK